MPNQLVSILIPQFQTLELTKLCLRSLRKYTDLDKAEIIVIDNGSKDSSIDYLRSIRWITLIERDPVPGEDVGAAHARALDLGFAHVKTPYVLSIHTDTIVTAATWLDFLLEQIGKSANTAGVGSWKLEFKPRYKRIAKQIEGHIQAFLTKCFPSNDGNKKRKTDNHWLYLRSHCALYRSDLIRRFDLRFGDGDTAGKVMHKKLVENGYDMVFLDTYSLATHIRHLNHATMILNPEIAGRKTGSSSERRRILRELKDLNFQEILNNHSLDSR